MVYIIAHILMLIFYSLIVCVDILSVDPCIKNLFRGEFPIISNASTFTAPSIDAQPSDDIYVFLTLNLIPGWPL